MVPIRNTIQKGLILAALRELHHPTAEDVYAAVAQRYPSIGRGTVYRNLNAIAQRGEIQKIKIPGGADIFDITTRSHYHIHCRICSRVFDIDMDYLNSIEKMIRNNHGFCIEGHDIVFRGVCPDCNEKQ